MAALATAVAALLLFGSVHAYWLVPIWPQLLGGLPFTLVGSLALAWAFAELVGAGLLPRRPWVAGFVFGAGVWLALLPATGVSLLLRATGMHEARPDVSFAIEMASAALTGASLAATLKRGWQLGIALGAATCVMLAVQAGPIPVTNGSRPLGLFFFLAAIYVACGVLQAVATAWLETRVSADPDIAG